jgi:hypothetical protein
MVDNEHAPLIDSFGSFNTDLHCVLATVSWGRIHLCGWSASSKFRSESCEGMKREKESLRKKSDAKRRECRERAAVSCCFVSFRLLFCFIRPDTLMSGSTLLGGNLLVATSGVQPYRVTSKTYR